MKCQNKMFESNVFIYVYIRNKVFCTQFIKLKLVKFTDLISSGNNNKKKGLYLKGNKRTSI